MKTLMRQALTGTLMLWGLFMVTTAQADLHSKAGQNHGAQSDNCQYQKMGHRRPDMDALAGKLGLDKSQTKKLQGIMDQHHQQMMSMRQQGHQERGAHAEQRKAMRDAHHKQLLTVLNSEQLSKFEAYMHENRPGKGRKQGDHEENEQHDRW